MNQKLRRAIVEPWAFNLSTKSAWHRYQEIGQPTEGSIRTEIFDSWEKSKKLGIDPFQKRINEIIGENDLNVRLEKNEQFLSFASQKVSSLSSVLDDSKTFLSMADRHGTILNSYGERSVVKKAESLNISAGGTWSEKSAGTNAVGIVLKTKQPAQVLFSEHFCEEVHEWYCVASPILAPFTNELLGIVNIAGYLNKVNQHTIGLIIAETNNISKSIEQRYYEYALRNNLFLNTALEGVDDAVFAVDTRKTIIEKNEAARLDDNLKGIQSLNSLPELDKLVDKVLLSGQQIIREEISDYERACKYICSIYPVTYQTEHLGAVVFFRKSTTSGSKLKRPVSQSTRYSFDNIVGTSPAFSEVVKKAKKAATINATLFLAGETGTGKEVFAQAIHQASDRRDQPFVAINCGAIPHGLLESELSGYEAGAFTGAKSKGNAGKFEMAQGGTIFLDEIGDMPLDLQVHLLRILEEKVVTRIGGKKEIPIDVRVIAATHKNLTEAVSKGKFREDLLYRLRVIQLEIPALRERNTDIPALVNYFIKQLSAEFGKQDVLVHTDTMEFLMQYKWSGNIRELKNVVQQALFNMEGAVLLPFDLPLHLLEAIESPWETEKEQLIEAMKRENGQVTSAAKILGISRATLYRRIKQYNLTAEHWHIEN